MAKSFDFESAPGHLIRRMHQASVAIFAEETAGFDVTAVQFAMLNAVMDAPGIDQVTLAAQVAFDAATSGSVIGRLESKGWLRREADTQDRRRKLLWLTPAGQAAVRQMKRQVTRVQTRLLAPLDTSEREQLMQLMNKLVRSHQVAGGESA